MVFTQSRAEGPMIVGVVQLICTMAPGYTKHTKTIVDGLFTYSPSRRCVRNLFTSNFAI